MLAVLVLTLVVLGICPDLGSRPPSSSCLALGAQAVWGQLWACPECPWHCLGLFCREVLELLWGSGLGKTMEVRQRLTQKVHSESTPLHPTPSSQSPAPQNSLLCAH